MAPSERKSCWWRKVDYCFQHSRLVISAFPKIYKSHHTTTDLSSIGGFTFDVNCYSVSSLRGSLIHCNSCHNIKHVSKSFIPGSGWIFILKYYYVIGRVLSFHKNASWFYHQSISQHPCFSMSANRRWLNSYRCGLWEQLLPKHHCSNVWLRNIKFICHVLNKVVAFLITFQFATTWLKRQN